MTAPPVALGGIVFLMYHELELPGRPLLQSEPGYVRYILREATFRSQIDWLRKNGWRGLSVSNAMLFPSEKSVAITFDDGCETDLIAAASILRDAGFNATFYVTAGFVDKPGYLSIAQLRALSASGFEIGCHSMTHAYLNDLTPKDLRREIVDARHKLEDAIGKQVEHFSCPGGRYDERTVALAKQAGYRSLATSRAYANQPSTDPFRLGRVAIMRETNQPDFEKICTSESLWKIRLGNSVRNSARKWLGNSLYDRVRAAVLRQS
jgi:peptidoglycan/xylan/chitin deacetylase (PgdA/CDA1 family)